MPMSDDEKAAYFEDLMWASVEKLFAQLDGDWDSLSSEEQDIVALWRAEADIYNGGFIQFFCNWGETTFATARNALQKIGAQHSLALFERFASIMADMKDDERITELWDMPQYLSAAQLDALSALDEQYWDNPDNLCLLAYRYYCQVDA